MGVIAGTFPSPALASGLNPNAPPFVPAAYRAVEDFSEQWWALVQSSPWFRDYWLEECFSDPQEEEDFSSDILLPEDLDALFDDYDFLKRKLSTAFSFPLSASVARWLASLDFWTRVSLFSAEEDEKKGGCMDLVPIGGFDWRKSRAEKPRFAEKAPKIVNLKVSPRMIQQPR